jgi:hypothetical protein
MTVSKLWKSGLATLGGAALAATLVVMFGNNPESWNAWLVCGLAGAIFGILAYRTER